VDHGPRSLLHCFLVTKAAADAHRDDGKRFVAHADEKLTAFWNCNRQFPDVAIHKVRWTRELLVEGAGSDVASELLEAWQ